ncbi:phage tail tape measure protein, partial [Desulfocurvibacter africanus]
AVLPLLGGALAAVSWPIWLIVAAVGVLALAWRTNFGGMADRMKSWWNTITLVGRGVMAVFASLEDGVGTISGQLAQDIDAAGLVGLVTTVARIAYRVREFWLGMTEAISTAWDAAVTNISPVLSALGDSFGWLAELVGMAVSALFGFGAASDVSAWRIAGEVVGTLLGGAFQTLATAIRIATIPLRLVGGLLGFIVDLASGMDLAEAGSKLITTFWEGIKSEAGALYENFKSLLGPLAQLLPHSDAKEGPLSTLTASGAAIPDTLGEGV